MMARSDSLGGITPLLVASCSDSTGNTQPDVPIGSRIDRGVIDPDQLICVAGMSELSCRCFLTQYLLTEVEAFIANPCCRPSDYRGHHGWRLPAKAASFISELRNDRPCLCCQPFYTHITDVNAGPGNQLARPILSPGTEGAGKRRSCRFQFRRWWRQMADPTGGLREDLDDRIGAGAGREERPDRIFKISITGLRLDHALFPDGVGLGRPLEKSRVKHTGSIRSAPYM